MKKLITLLLCSCSLIASAQNGFFLQPEAGAGLSNTCWQPYSFAGNPGQSSIFSYQGQMDIGYKTGKWQFLTGIGYLRTGVKQSYDYIVTPFFAPGIAMDFNLGAFKKTAYDPHVMLPVKIGFDACHFNNRLTLTPIIGAQYVFNTPRTFIYQNGNSTGHKETETQQEFTMLGNETGVIGLLQLNLEYRLNARYDITAGPSLHYMFTSEVNFANEYDYSVLINVGLKWNFKHRKTTL